MSIIQFLSVEDVKEIHNLLVKDAQNSEDPISPPGVKSNNMLESAVSRQTVGYGGRLKYANPIVNAVTLCYGICCNHPLHNGNKRTALLSMISHLDKNGFTLNQRANQSVLYSFMLNVAGHKLVPKRKLKGTPHADQSDLEIQAMEKWVRKKSRRIEKGERLLSYNDLEKILKNHDVLFENHKGNYADVIKYETRTTRVSFFGKTKTSREGRKVAHIPYWPGRSVGKGLVKSIRKQAGLTYSDGIDSALFYGTQTLPDDFIQKYKKVLIKLAKT